MNPTNYRVRLYFGTEVPLAQRDRLQKATVGPFDRSLLRDVLAREFPAGFTLLSGSGNWQGPDGRTVTEETIIAEIVGEEQIVERARYVGRWFKAANGQDSVLLTVEPLAELEFI